MRPLGPLTRFAQPRQGSTARPGERCELCAAPIAEPHPHVADLKLRALCCSCPTCARLFASPAAGSRYRAVPDRVRHDPQLALGDREWEELGIPVGLVFVFFNSQRGRWSAVYPSPAGATESELTLEPWEELSRSVPLIAAAQPDVEALLIHRPRGGGASECLLVPIDTCYELVALVRRHWRGFQGGERVHREIAGFFARLRERSRPLKGGEGR